jgi:hypothetical protein
MFVGPLRQDSKQTEHCNRLAVSRDALLLCSTRPYIQVRSKRRQLFDHDSGGTASLNVTVIAKVLVVKFE